MTGTCQSIRPSRRWQAIERCEPGVEVDFAECAAATALFVADAVPGEADRPRELEGIRETFRDAFELFPVWLLSFRIMGAGTQG